MNGPDALLVVPPLSPSDTNPPLGPYLLRTSLANEGLAAEVLDLSIRYINHLSPATYRTDRVLGDQDKDRRRTALAKDHFAQHCALRIHLPAHKPLGANAVQGMHYTFEAVEEAVTVAADSSFWSEFLRQEVFAPRAQPRVLGISIMGPQQVFVSLVLAKMCRRWWPGTIIAAGGSHITLLETEIAADARYGPEVDVFFPGHSEARLGSFLSRVRAGGSLSELKTPTRVIAGKDCESPKKTELTARGMSLRASDAPFELLPTLNSADLTLYDPQRVTIPMQLTRGCSYARCSYCTYPSVEPGATIHADWAAVGNCIQTLVDRHGIRRFSFKDSYFTPKNLRAFGDMLHDRKLEIQWSATTMLNARLTPGLVGMLQQLGLRTLEFGLESTDDAGQSVFEKRLKLGMVEEVIGGVCGAGVDSVINQIFGWPGQSLESAEAQFAWFEGMQQRFPGLVHGSMNMLEVNRRAPMATNPAKFGIRLGLIAPWAFSYAWNAPAWGPRFQERLASATLEQPLWATTP